MTHSRFSRSTALASAAVLALGALQGCDQLSAKAGLGHGASGPPASSQDPNGYAPTGGPAQSTDVASGGQTAPADTAPLRCPPAGRGGVASGGGPSGSAQPVRNTGVYVSQPPPPIPEYDQPPPPADGYYWTPGYWDYSEADDDYYWAPGVWVQPPDPGLYWTPGYWSFVDGGYAFYPGYWGPVVGFYGGVNYGWGYGGRGYFGGRWSGGRFFYNGVLNNLRGRRMDNVYRQNAPNWSGSRVSYSGGRGGLRIAPTPQQISAARAGHVPATGEQRRQLALAQREPGLRAGVNHGRPSVVATSRVGDFHGPGAVTTVTSAAHYDPPGRIQAGDGPAFARGAAIGVGAAAGAALAAHAISHHAPASSGRQGFGAERSQGARMAPAVDVGRAREAGLARSPERSYERSSPRMTPPFRGAPKRPEGRGGAGLPHPGGGYGGGEPRAEARAAPPRSEPRDAPRPEARAAPGPRAASPASHPEGHGGGERRR